MTMSMDNIKLKSHSCALLSIYINDKFEWVQQSIDSIDMDIVDKVYIGLDGQVGSDILSFLEKLDKNFYEVVSFKENRGLHMC